MLCYVRYSTVWCTAFIVLFVSHFTFNPWNMPTPLFYLLSLTLIFFFISSSVKVSGFSGICLESEINARFLFVYSRANSTQVRGGLVSLLFLSNSLPFHLNAYTSTTLITDWPVFFIHYCCVSGAMHLSSFWSLLFHFYLDIWRFWFTNMLQRGWRKVPRQLPPDSSTCASRYGLASWDELIVSYHWLLR